MRSLRQPVLPLLSACLWGLLGLFGPLALTSVSPTTVAAQDTPPTAPADADADANPDADAQDGADDADSSEVDPAESRATQFRAVSGGTTEDVPGGPLVLAAYFGILLLLFVFLWRQSRLVTAAHRELQALRDEALNRSE